MCNECLEALKKKTSIDDIRLLEVLLKEECFDTQRSFPREVLMQKAELSIHRFTHSLTKLEFAGFVEGVRFGKTNQYFITEAGQNLLDLLRGE